ncbi:hypothetical protein TNCV_389141 [Trichonephila clavipes]|nr:hypothetical protein TNCV_389141 [Trichonephila clavipes]
MHQVLTTGLPNLTDKFRGVIGGSMGTTNQNRICGCKPRLVGENRNNSSRQEDDELDEGSGQANAEIYIYCPNRTMTQNILFPYSTSSRSCSREYRPLYIRTCGLYTMVHQHIFRLWGVTTSMLHIPEGGLSAVNLLLASTFPGPQFLGFYLGPIEIACV